MRDFSFYLEASNVWMMRFMVMVMNCGRWQQVS